MRKKEFSYPRDFKGVFIPKEVYLDDDLSALEMIILSEIYSLDVDGSDGCYASNEYLASFCKCGVTKISNAVTKLKNMGYITSVKTDGRTRWIKVDLQGKKNRNTDKIGQGCKKCKSEMQEVKQSNIDVDDIDNNINDNTPNSLSNDKDNSKDKSFEYYNSPVSEKQESRISMSLGVRPKQSKEITLKDMPTRAKEIVDNLVDDKELSEGVYDCIEYFLEKYRKKNRKEHLPLRNDTLQRVVEVMLSTLTVTHDEDLENMYESDFFPLVSSMSDWEDRKEVIDKYFETDFREKCDYSLVHFTQKDVITHVMQKCYIGNDINWYDSIPY